ncbi:MAG: ATP-binding cassette domain-containing protein, partial [Candidatus Cloacimonas sp.]|nr:ATP-binding cassette domain-containing protein [Candidatus Cloacimonas sp.]
MILHPEPPKPSLLSATGIKKSFLFRGSVSIVLDKADFQVNQGEFVSIIGPSGCGKSTFLELLAGISKPDKGQISFNGEDITGKTGMLGYMPQDDLLFPWLDATQNILLPVRVKNGN